MGRKAKEINPKTDTGTAVATMEQDRLPARHVDVKLAHLVDQSAELGKMANLPEEFKGAETLAGFPPSAKFETAGDAVFGFFINMRAGVGPNNSRLYEVAVPQGDGKDPLVVAVWGSAAVDRLWDSAFPPIQTGDKVGVIYLGEKATKRGLNPVKLFALKVLRAGGKVSTSHAS